MSEAEQITKAEVKELIDLLQYQDGSKVSRVLLKNKGAPSLCLPSMKVKA